MKKPFIIGITGGSGSGKTSIIKLLRDKFSEAELCLISQDNYYLDRNQQLHDDNGVINFDLPTCLNEKQFLQDIRTLMEGKSIEFTEYTFNNDLRESRVIKIHSAPIIVVEGLFVFYYEEMRKLMDLKVYVDASDIVKLKRRIQRDQVERNYPIDDVLYRYEYHVTPAYQNYILPFKRQADIIINNEYKFDNAVQMIEGFIRSKINE
jgi:uridine kinase